MNSKTPLLRRLSFRARIIITFTSLTAILLVIMAQVGYYSVRTLYLNQLSEQTGLLTQLIAKNLGTRYLTFLDPLAKDNPAFDYYQRNMQAQADAMLLPNIFIFDDNFKILARANESQAVGSVDTRLLLNKTEIEALAVGKYSTSLPFKGDDKQWYMWGFYRMNRHHWLGIQENASRLERVESLASYFTWISFAGILLTGLIGWVLARSLAKPVEKLISFSQLLGQGKFDTAIPEGIYGELQTLANALDKMRHDLDRHHQEKETMLAQIAHEIRNPLGGMELLAGLVREDLQQQQADSGYIDKILSEIAGLKSLISDYLNYSRPQQARPEMVNIPEVLADASTDWEQVVSEKEIRLSKMLETDTIYFDRHHLRQVLSNLLGNSAQASPKNGEITISATAEGKDVAISVADEGPGISPENIPRIFDPFFTTRDEGTGLGLAICQKLCRENGMEILVENNPESGCTFTFRRNTNGKLAD